MPDHLIILLGAGASYDCASGLVLRDGTWRPPLTRELFDQRFQPTLNNYPLAEAAASDIQPILAREENPVPLEEFLRETLRNSSHLHRRRQFRAIPLYLQHLLFECGSWESVAPGTRRIGPGYTNNPDNYNRLISIALELDEAIFVTLNYDTLLDRRLFAYSPLASMDSYIDSPTNWSLIKLHGSVDWGQLVLSDWERAPSDPFLAATFAALEDEITVDDEIRLRLSADLGAKRHEGGSNAQSGGYLYYPALSAPLGPGDELVCPPEHTAHLRDRLRAYDGLHLFVIGYSGLDEEVLKLLHESENHLRSLTIVNESEASAAGTQAAIGGAIGLGGNLDVSLVADGFDQYSQSDEMRERIESLA